MQLRPNFDLLAQMKTLTILFLDGDGESFILVYGLHNHIHRLTWLAPVQIRSGSLACCVTELAIKVDKWKADIKDRNARCRRDTPKRDATWYT